MDKRNNKMNKDVKQTWETYVKSWKVETAEEKHALLKQCMSSNNKYNDPVIQTNGQTALTEYMLDFHQQIPGGHFVTTYFLAHSNKSIARWEMRNNEGQKITDGISYAEYNENGKLISETGFFELPAA